MVTGDLIRIFRHSINTNCPETPMFPSLLISARFDVAEIAVEIMLPSWELDLSGMGRFVPDASF